MNSEVGHPSLSTKGKAKSPRLTRVIDSVRLAKATGAIIPGEKINIHWEGMQLLSLNEMLRQDHRGLHGYIKACHEAVRFAIWELSGAVHAPMFEDPVHLVLTRSGRNLVDIDGMYSSFKFIIDGFRYCRVLNDDDPLHVHGISHIQTKGSPSIGISLQSIKAFP